MTGSPSRGADKGAGGGGTKEKTCKQRLFVTLNVRIPCKTKVKYSAKRKKNFLKN